MSNDWLNLFVHQGKEFLDSVSKPRVSQGSESMSSTNSTMHQNDGDNVSASALSLQSLLATNDGGTSIADGRKIEKSSSEIKPVDSASVGAISSEGGNVGKVPLSQGEKEIYETQLEQLQEQLVDVMIKNQEMGDELSVLRASDVFKVRKELEREQIKCQQLKLKLKKFKEQENDFLPKLKKRRKPLLKEDESSGIDDKKTSPEVKDNVDETYSNEDLPAIRTRTSRFRHCLYTLYLSVTQKLTLTFWNIVSDLSNDDTSVERSVEEDGPPLAIKTLKDNISRFSKGLKPIQEFSDKVNWVLSWKNPAATLLILLVYWFSFWHGLTVSIILFFLIVQLSANFIHHRFGTISEKKNREDEHQSWSDKFQIVLHVARKVQNVLGDLSDYLEKFKNLVMWEVPSITLKLYIVLWFIFLLSILLSGPQLFMIIGMFLGWKLFIVNPLYARFPKLKKRYDTTHRLWLQLPVDNKLNNDVYRNALLEFEIVEGEQVSDVPFISETFSLNSKLFCERYKIASDEILVKGWEEGWRASLMDKQKPLVNMKHGHLYLTQNYLCFERSRTNITKNILMKLSDIKRLNKYKPLFLLPGSGMSIEVVVKDKDEPYIFGALIGRDEAYNNIIQMGKLAGLSWALTLN
ncbi:GRAM domain-containing protein 4-like [Xenia sp. Carnegie-2017]|uniref:GRAM domain-containing protein 4-like n=1 Tax=Xenia sp. Carnegie-2017 TaxID=2897299 RepID=UPI001F03B6C1|nr:GRAM domain-containing protein 4-like [Xenia sp. Carnegie-2017]